MISLKDYITEEEIKPYRFVYLWFDDPDDPDDPESTADDFISEGKKLGLKDTKLMLAGPTQTLIRRAKDLYMAKMMIKDFQLMKILQFLLGLLLQEENPGWIY